MDSHRSRDRQDHLEILRHVVINIFVICFWLVKRPSRIIYTAMGVVVMAALAHTPAHAAPAAPRSESATLGPTYPISEPDFLKALEAKLKAKEASGELARIQKEAIERSQRSIHNPPVVSSVQHTITPRSFFWDPTIAVAQDLSTTDGKVFAKAGTRVNPLDSVSLSQALLFFDARDPRQVAMAERIKNERDGAVKMILTGGSYIDLMRQWKSRVYYDQGGRLVAKLGIGQVPAIVVQDGRRLRIDEMRVAP